MRRSVPLEKAEYEVICKLLTLAGFAVYRLSQARKSKQTPGLPDLYAFFPTSTIESAVWIEVKRQGWTESDVRPAQKAFRGRCQQRNMRHLVGDRHQVASWLIENGWNRLRS